jgi:hypothetical protein
VSIAVRTCPLFLIHCFTLTGCAWTVNRSVDVSIDAEARNAIDVCTSLRTRHRIPIRGEPFQTMRFHFSRLRRLRFSNAKQFTFTCDRAAYVRRRLSRTTFKTIVNANDRLRHLWTSVSRASPHTNMHRGKRRALRRCERQKSGRHLGARKLDVWALSTC